MIKVVERAHQSISSEHGGFISCQCACDEVAYVPFRVAANSARSELNNQYQELGRPD